jgi:sugar phosphate permease
MLARAFDILKPAPVATKAVAPEDVGTRYRYWRGRILYASLIGYALFYLVRKNLPVAMPEMEHALGISKSQLGIFLTLHGVVYGLSKFLNGFAGDRTNPRYFMALGLLCSAGVSIAFGLSSGVAWLGILWVLNGWFQGMGFPPCARTLTHWFTAKERATKFGIWNTSHSLGAAATLLLCSGLVVLNWRYCFIVPGVISGVGALFVLNRLRDRPETLGLPGIDDPDSARRQAPVAAAPHAAAAPCSPKMASRSDSPEPAILEYAPVDSESSAEFRRVLMSNVFRNPAIWIVSFANFFVYAVRYALLDWGPTLLKESKGISLQQGGATFAAYEVAGAAGMLLAGWATDRIFRGRAGRTCLVYMLLCGGCVWLFRNVPPNSHVATLAVLAATGFCIYGPQCLTGVLAANLATRRAAATAIGLTGFFGYLSTAASGWGLGWMAQHHGWDPVYNLLMIACAIAAALFALLWNAGPEAAPSARKPELIETADQRG